MPPTQTRLVQTEHLFGEARPFSQCHAPTLLRLADGRFLAAWFAGTREGHPDVAIWAAVRAAEAGAQVGASRGAEPRADAAPGAPGAGAGAEARAGGGANAPAQARQGAPGAGWSTPRPIARVREAPHWNPVLYALDEDTRALVLQFKVGESIRRWESYGCRSDDGGERWSPPLELVPGDRGGRGAVRCKPIRLASGAWLAGASIERWRRWDAFFDRSPNGVDGWQRTAFVEVDRRQVGKGLIQPTLFEGASGRVTALFRSTGGRVYRAESHDEGRTWGAARPTDVPNNNSGIDVARLADGRLALACNPVGVRGGPRTPLSLLFSEDEGATWPERLDVETDPGEFSYPAIVADGEGLALAYTWNRRRIAFARIGPDAIHAAA